MTHSVSRLLASVSLPLCAVAMLSACDPAPTQMTPTDFTHQSSNLPVDPAVRYGKLENGLRYAVMPNATPTNTASIRMWFGTGSLNESDDTQGLAHFLEHMAFNGSENMPEGEMTKTLERYGLAFGADTNAYTSFDETVYQLDLPETSEEMFDVTLSIMRETASNLTLDPEAIDRERGIVISEKRRRNSPGWRAQMASFDFYLGDTRIPDRIPIGTEEDMNAVLQNDFRTFYDGYYRPENTFLVIVGDADPDFVITQIEEHFADWTPRGEALQNLGAGTVKPSGVRVGYFSDPQVPTSVSLSVMKPFQDKQDTAEQRKTDLIASLGDAMFNRRLSSLARQEDAVFHGGGASNFDLFEAAEVSSVTLSTSPGNWEAAMGVADQEMRRALKYGFSQAELDEQLANYRKSFQVAAQTASTRRTPSLANSLVQSFSGEQVFTTPQSSLDRFEGFADDITVEMVWEAFKDRWSGFETPLIYVSHSEGIENHEAVIKEAWEISRTVEVEAPAEQITQDFAYTDFGGIGKIASRDHIEDLDIHTIRFENNVLLNIKRTDFDKDSIRINVQIGDGFLSLPMDNLAVSEFADYAMGTGGLAVHSADELQRVLAGRAVGARFRTGTDSFSLSGSTVPEDLLLQMQLLAAYATAPGFRPEAKSRFDKQIESWYPTLASTPGGVASRDVPRLIRSGDPRFGVPSLETILSADLDGVANWLKPQLDNGFIEISIVGDVDVEKAVDAVARTFGALPERAPQRDSYDAASRLKFPEGTDQVVILTHSGEDNRALIRIYWPAPDGTDQERSRKLDMLERVLNNRLIEVIREQEGATYSPSSSRYSPKTYPGYGYFVVSLDLDPKDVDRMFAVVEEITADFAAGNISQDEFDRAQKPILEQIEESLESNGYWGSVVARAQSDSDYLENARTRGEAYANMTLEDIKPFAAEIFVPSKAYKIKIVPE